MDFVKRLESLDFHPKLVKDFAVRTKTGAGVSLVALTVAALLFWSELNAYWTAEKVEHMEVDPVRGAARMRVNFDVTFPDMPCAVVSLDAMDASGSHQLEIMHDVHKRRVNHAGEELFGAAVVPLVRGTLKNTEQLLKEKEKAVVEGRPAEPDAVAAAANSTCGSCYGAQMHPDDCCNTCEQVRDMYRCERRH